MYGPHETDQFVCQIDRTGRRIFMLQDAGGHVVGLVDDLGRLLEQYSWEPYGEVIAAESFHPHPVNRVGHKGLFFERYDGSISELSISPGASGLYYNRNRFYSPRLGRYLTPDPNETALPILAAAAANAQTMSLAFEPFDLLSHYGDGPNRYQYLSGDPINGQDPLGLDDFDDAIDDLNGWRLYALGAIADGAGFASAGMNTLLDIAGGILGVDILQSAFSIAGGGGGFWA